MSPAFRLSIGINVVLLGLVAVLLWRDHSPALPPATPSAQPAGALPAQPATVAMLAATPANTDGPNFTPAVVTQLEQAGVAHETLVNVLLEDLARRSARRHLELQKKYAPRSVPDRAVRELARANDAEQIRELKAAFGEEGYRAWDKEQTLRNLNRARAPGDELPLTAGEAEQAYRLQKQFDEKNQELQMAMEDGVADRADAGALQAQAQKALDAALRQLLGEQRFSELRGNLDPAAEVHRTFGDLNPTPTQASAVVQAEADHRAGEAALATRLKDNSGATLNLAAELKALNEKREENLRGIFGAEAYDRQQRQHDPIYQTLTQYAQAWELKDQEVQSVYEVLHALHDQADQLRLAAETSETAGQRVNWREVGSTIDQARLQAEAGLQNLIGGERLRRLKQNGVLP